MSTVCWGPYLGIHIEFWNRAIDAVELITTATATTTTTIIIQIMILIIVIVVIKKTIITTILITCQAIQIIVRTM